MGREVHRANTRGPDLLVIFIPTPLDGAYVVDPEPIEDQRGFFARTWCQREFQARGLESRLVQCSVSFNKFRGTLRGMHYQAPPHEEDKLVRCTRGSIHDVIIDLRVNSRTFKQHFGIVLSAENRNALFVPKGFAHGFQTLEHDTEIFYQMSEFYVPEDSKGLRWDDPAFGICWPIENPLILERDRNFADFRQEHATPA
jgi:dTDP-4-dehydrorhamnose 3,5-epimerase